MCKEVKAYIDRMTHALFSNSWSVVEVARIGEAEVNCKRADADKIAAMMLVNMMILRQTDQ